ncbi:hypothetical protein CALVIDRAFT_105350 [Calocera viscosa TUFC12733]|uniref:Uncharacterized protein n=1 Tax=Calocera viscosa (strain TUFC12733) TaxID=1330018 RepID=A0A167MPX2_CALVF|nr:hypothetical protein CALVIDRAFT_105350 [Calocera viscosa TUFC12733]
MDAPRPPMPELMTPQDIAKAKRNSSGKASPDKAGGSNSLAEAGGSAASSSSLKRKTSDEGPLRPPPALRGSEQSQRPENVEGTTAPNARKENSGPSIPAKRKNGAEGPKRPPPNMRSPNKQQRYGNHVHRRGGGSSNSSRPSPTASRSNPAPVPGPSASYPTLGNPIAVPSNDPPPRPRPLINGSGSTRAPQRLPPRGDGTTSQTMFIPKKRGNNPNPPPTGPSNARQRLMQETRQPPR